MEAWNRGSGYWSDRRITEPEIIIIQAGTENRQELNNPVPSPQERNMGSINLNKNINPVGMQYFSAKSLRP